MELGRSGVHGCFLNIFVNHASYVSRNTLYINSILMMCICI